MAFGCFLPLTLIVQLKKKLSRMRWIVKKPLLNVNR